MDERKGFVPDFNEYLRELDFILDKKYLRKAGKYFSEYFDIKENDNIIYLEQILYIEDIPILIEEVFIPEYVLPEIKKLNYAIFSFKDIFEYYGKICYEEYQTLEIVKGPKYIRQKLNVKDNLMVIFFHYSYLDIRGRNILFSKRWYDGENVNFKIKL